ncbi:uncharacterized protein LOC110421820 [Herrania umbratica]|uniref:Uncharacterized protein LOC110421820 n=1 Tax=Herrania umbratica TaxID=108875 RepID=A0A6J1AW09_9ROSI|nr:uncharacterized protein LOC110421820 [Herrania umbratica]
MMDQQAQKNETTEQVPEVQPSASQKKEAADQQALQLIELSERLFEYAMKNQWQNVVKAYMEKPESQKAKITEAEDTALHLAVSGGKLEFVCQLVEILGENASDVLKVKNKRGNTPLHTAAILGNAHMCHCMASKDFNLIAEKNKQNETPFYLAAKYGHKNAFFCLYFCYPQGKRWDIRSRDASGNTILHAAIDGEHFDLAFQIICKYRELVNAFNVNGSSPLHVLATKANAFKSGSRLGLFDRLLYRCIIVDEMTDKKYESMDYLKRFEENGSHRPCFPQTHETCVRFFRMFLGVACFGMPEIRSFGRKLLSYINGQKKKSNSVSDEENPQGTSKVTDQGTSPKAKEDGKDKSYPELHRADYFPKNYNTFIQFFKFLIKFVMVVLGLGFQRIKKIATKKQRHTWASQVMDKLIENASMYKYSGGQTGTGIAGMTEEFPCNPSLMSASRQDTNTGNDSKVETLDKQGECHNKTGSSTKEGNDALVQKFLGEYHITGTVDSKTSKHAVQMKFEKKVAVESTKRKTPILIAASNGITEMVGKILDKFPVAIQDVDAENKNVMLLAVENRQTHTFQFLVEKKVLHESVFRQRDNQGNNALHLAATYGHYRSWLIPGSALQMQWELKWYKFVKKSLAKNLLGHYNNMGQTPKQIFTETHKALVKDGSEWLTKTSESCSLIAALIATVAFATAANIPGGVSEDTGKPVLRDEPAFCVFAILSLVALCFSVTALVFFLAILTSRFEEKDFASKLPRKLIWGLTSLFTSIAAILFSFCAGHFFELRDKLKFAALPIYTATCLPISFFALAQLPLYFDLLWAIWQKVPQRCYKESAS